MAGSTQTSPAPSARPAKSEERREWLRIDDRILLEYALAGEPLDSRHHDLPPVTEEAIATAVSKPTLDLLSRAGATLAESPLLPWVSKIDWMLETILKSLAKIQPGSVSIARLVEVNISAGGIGFVTPRRFKQGDVLAVRLILPPFTLIQTTAKVIRVTGGPGATGVRLATQFDNLAPDDQEHIIRHILQVQAERLRARKSGH